MEERLQVGKATRSTPRIHPSLRALIERRTVSFAAGHKDEYFAIVDIYRASFEKRQ